MKITNTNEISQIEFKIVEIKKKIKILQETLDPDTAGEDDQMMDLDDIINKLDRAEWAAVEMRSRIFYKKY